MATENISRKEPWRTRLWEHGVIDGLLETAQAIVLLLDSRGRILRSNPYLERASGYRSAELHGKDWVTTLLPRGEQERVRRVFRAALGDVPARGVICPVVGKDGGKREVEWCCRAFKDAGGVARGILAVGQAIDERSQPTEAARQRRAELEHLDRVSTMGEFASGLAHELNQPLCAISACVETCLRLLRTNRHVPREVATALRHAAAQSTRAAEIIRRMRAFVCKHETSRNPVDVNDVIKEAASLAQAEAKRHGVSIRLDLAERLPVVWLDDIQIQQVLLNLVRNGIDAIDNTVERRGEITISSASKDGEVRVAVRDSGCGLPTEDVDRVFESFYTTKAYGLGLGLPLSRSLVEAHSGRLWATRNGDRGATFHFTLPAKAGVPWDESRTDCVHC